MNSDTSDRPRTVALSREAGTLSIRIGDADRYVTGEHLYIIHYTARRAIPAVQLNKPYVLTLIALFALGFIAATAGFWVIYDNPLPLLLSVPVLAVLCIYPLLKRFTSLCH